MGQTYKRNYLKQVIVRIDFLNPILPLNEQVPLDLSSSIAALFPIPEPREIIANELQIRADSTIQQREEKIREWNFHSRERDKFLCITSNCMFISFSVYKSFEDLQMNFTNITATLFKVFKDMQIRRLGLRYINNVEIPGGDPLKWSTYLNKNLISIFNFVENKKTISRAFHNLELNFGSFNLKLQYGMPNPDFPAPIKKKIFVLDYDAYYQGFMKEAEMKEGLIVFHEEIQKLFEKSISDKLKVMLNA
ncbi:MAG: TIGR04255 family protein [Bacillota bacterium]